MKYLSLFIYLFILVTLTNCQKSQDATNPDITTDLVAYYPFSGNALDSSGNGFHGTLLGVISTTDRSGKSNSAFRFIGNNKIGIPALTPLNNAQKLTFSFWKRTTSVKNWATNFNVLDFGGKFVINMSAMPLYKRDTIYIRNNQVSILGGAKNDVGSWNHYAIMGNLHQPITYIQTVLITSYSQFFHLQINAVLGQAVVQALLNLMSLMK